MPDNLRITTPVNNSQGISKPNPAAESSPAAPINPSRVPQSGNQKQNTQDQAMDLLRFRNSVYGQFLKQLESTPDLSQTLQKIALNAVNGQKISAAHLPADSPLRALASSITMQKGDILKNLTFQRENASLFSGKLFQLLGQISQQHSDSRLDLQLADFLKAFCGYCTAQDTTQAIFTNLETIRNRIPVPYAKQLSGEIRKLSGNAENTNQNLALLKEKIIPLLGKYVSKTNDYGKSREAISMLLHNTSILNVSTQENLSQKFEQLLHYCKYSLNLPDTTINRMKFLFAGEIAVRRENSTDNAFCKAFLSLLSHAGGKDSPAGTDAAALHDICQSVLLDNSVYMPFQHIFLPVSIDGRFLFTQIWIEKKETGTVHGKAAIRKPSAVYLTFEIQDLGYFEASMQVLGKQVSMNLSCPAVLNRLHGEIRSGITEILQKNGLTPGSVRLSSGGAPQIPSLILEKINERKDSVDVTV